MSGRPGQDGSSAWAGALARASLALYPQAWRARYADEVRALLDDSGAGPRAVASLAWRAVVARAWPPRHLYDRAGRMRASLATVLAAWTVLAGLTLLFAQLTEAQGIRPAGHPVIGWCYLLCEAAGLASALLVVAGGLPLWWLMMRRSLREHRRREVACLLAPVVVPVAYLAAVALTVRLVPHANGVGPAWFLVILVSGFAAGGLFAAGPALALRRLRPRGPAVTLAMRAAGAAAAAMALAGAASAAAAAGLYWWAPGYAGYHQRWPLAVYLPLVALAAIVASVSAARGTRAARQPAG